ncbi:MAG: hypothetical protein RLY35_1998 [Bacteroidota bacterium]|jgi:deoxyribodipyrimidine photo-lyase
MLFPPKTHDDLLQAAARIDPVHYARTRNHLRGGVTRLSPYISRGVISTREVMEQVRAAGHTWRNCESLFKELAWRDYFQRVQEHYPQLHAEAIKQEQTGVLHQGVPLAVQQAQTGIEGIDLGINEMLEVGYVHNHQRMYIAMLCCNIGQFHWKACADWMYYHLIDGDVASNYSSWQWTAGAFSSKRYMANQENINHNTETHQFGTFLDHEYDVLRTMPVPEVLGMTATRPAVSWTVENMVSLLNDRIPFFTSDKGNEKVVVYNTYQLKQEPWIAESHRKVLLLEPSFFHRFPISERVMNWMIEQAMMIPEITVFVGEWSAWREQYPAVENHCIAHPLFAHYEGKVLQRDWMFPEINGYYPSFFAYWKQVEKRYSW